MSCQQLKSNPNKFPIGVLGCGPKRTQFDIQQIKRFDQSGTLDYIGGGSKENYCACNKKPTRPHRTLSWDDPHNTKSYGIQYHSST
jgi:hypothetical protein